VKAVDRSGIGKDEGVVMIQFDQETCGNLEAALHREFLETNGLGGFASSTSSV